MSDNGWFVTSLMYLGMVFYVLVRWPLSSLVKLVGRYPKYTLNTALTIGGGASLWHALHYRVDSPRYTWLGFILLGFALVMVFFVVENPAPRRTVRNYNRTVSWFDE